METIIYYTTLLNHSSIWKELSQDRFWSSPHPEVAFELVAPRLGRPGQGAPSDVLATDASTSTLMVAGVEKDGEPPTQPRARHPSLGVPEARSIRSQVAVIDGSASDAATRQLLARLKKESR